MCNLLSVFHTVVMWVNEREGCYANGPLGHLPEPFQYLLCPAWRSREIRFECFSSITPRTEVKSAGLLTIVF